VTQLIATAERDRAARGVPRHGAPSLAEARALVVLAAPLILTQLAQMAVMTTDVFMLGRFSREALAAAAIGSTVFYAAWLAGSGPAFAVAPMIAQSLGLRPGDRAGVRAATRMGLWAVWLVAVPAIPLLWQARPVLLALHQDPALAVLAGQFVAMLALGLPFTLGYLVLRSFATAVGRPAPAMWVMAATIVFNATADYALIFGHFGAPRLGIVGSGLATASSSLFSFTAMAAVSAVHPHLRPYRVFKRFTRPALDRLGEVFRLGLPIGAAMTFEAMLFNTMTLVMGSFGATALAAHQIALNVASITFMVPLGIGMAASVRVGLAAGAGDGAGARRSGYTAMIMGLAFIGLCGAGMALWGAPIAGLYVGGRAAQDLQVIATAALFLKVAAAFQVFDAVQVVAGQSLRGLKDTRAPMFIAAGAYWLAGAPVCLLLAFPIGLKGLGVWIGLAVGLAVAAAALGGRFAWMTREHAARDR
jgi:MATE family multidrug resistance protein